MGSGTWNWPRQRLGGSDFWFMRQQTRQDLLPLSFYFCCPFLSLLQLQFAKAFNCFLCHIPVICREVFLAPVTKTGGPLLLFFWVESSKCDTKQKVQLV